MKELVFVDEDIFLDYFHQTDEKRAKEAANFFEKVVLGEVKAFTTTHVIVSLADRLENEFGWKRDEVATNIRLVLTTPNLKINYREVLFSALKLYEELNVSFNTAYHAEVIRRMDTNFYLSGKKDFQEIKNFKKWSDKR